MSFRPSQRARGPRLAAAVSLVAAAACVASLSACADDGPDEQRLHAAEMAAVASPLPFDMPSAATLRASSKRVFAHYLPSMPISIDNRTATKDYYTVHYLNPNGEAGKHRAYGGFLRDRPAVRNIRTEQDWILRDAQTEVRQAIAAGLDGFTYNVQTFPTDRINKNWYATKTMLDAARAVDPAFKIMLMTDMTATPGRVTPQTLAKYVAELGRHPAAYHLADGRLVVSPYLAERKSVTWWQQFLTAMTNTYGTRVALVPTFLDERTFVAPFAPISYGMGNWGARNPQRNDSLQVFPSSNIGRMTRVARLGKVWMQPVSVQDARPRSGVFDEAGNSENLRQSWQVAIRGNASWVQYATWNDYSEGSHMAPSARNGSTLLDLSSYYLAWYKTGTAPTIRRDTVYLSNRGHFAANRPTFPQTKLMQLRPGGTAARDTVEALVFLTSPATVQVKVGTRTVVCKAPAGVSACKAPLGTGPISAMASRGSTVVASVKTARTATTRPYVQDLEYSFASSRRTGTGMSTESQPPATPPTAPPTPAPGPVTRTLTPVADAYANEGAPGTSFGLSASLASKQKPSAISYLRFQVPSAPAGKVLRSATLRLTTNSLPSSGSTKSQEIRLAGNNWTETTLTWRNRPPVTTGLGALAAGSVPKKTYGISLNTAEVARLVGQRTLAIVSTGGDDAWFWSRDFQGSGQRPQLVLTYNN
jgi:hypothetical protein